MRREVGGDLGDAEEAADRVERRDVQRGLEAADVRVVRHRRDRLRARTVARSRTTGGPASSIASPRRRRAAALDDRDVPRSASAAATRARPVTPVRTRAGSDGIARARGRRSRGPPRARLPGSEWTVFAGFHVSTTWSTESPPATATRRSGFAVAGSFGSSSPSDAAARRDGRSSTVRTSVRSLIGDATGRLVTASRIDRSFRDAFATTMYGFTACGSWMVLPRNTATSDGWRNRTPAGVVFAFVQARPEAASARAAARTVRERITAAPPRRSGPGRPE